MYISKYVHNQKEAMFINREKAKSGTRKYVPGLTDARNVYVIV